jgi:2-polyprenyl-3-methyl-5-hydroxy-6-metoxy-1,4-benzoquinol methylase
MSNRNHWDKIYQHKTPDQRSWTQDVPYSSLAFIDALRLPLDARIIDIGGGESTLVYFLLEKGYQNITVLDISEEAIRHMKDQLGEKAILVNWIVSDIVDFVPPQPYDLWHDRATFHFLTTPSLISAYLDHARSAIPIGGHMVIGTFSKNGPDKCSGLPVRQYSEEMLTLELKDGFKKTKCITEDHQTPFQTTQHFLFCSFERE